MASSRTPHNLSEDQKLFLVELAKKCNSIEENGYSIERLTKKDAAWKKITLGAQSEISRRRRGKGVEGTVEK